MLYFRGFFSPFRCKRYVRKLHKTQSLRLRKEAVFQFLLALIVVVLFLGPDICAANAPDEVPLPQQKLPTFIPKSEPDVWSEEQIEKAQAKCSALLATVSIDYKPLEPVKKKVCGDPAPVKVSAIGEGENKIVISPAATLNCAMAAKLGKWFDEYVQPNALRHLKHKIIAINNIASYSCRRRYGNPKKPYSEHAFMNALDIAAFQPAKGKTITLVADWGISKWELAAREKTLRKKLAADQARKLLEALVAKKKTPPQPKDSGGKGDKQTASVPVKAPTEEEITTINEEAKLWAEKIDLDVRTPAEIKQLKNPRLLFLREIYDGACELFGTVLSPEANRAHRNHFHIDLAPRKRSAYCE